MTSLLLLLAFLLLALLGVGLALRRLGGASPGEELDLSLLEQSPLVAERYRPLGRLFGNRDLLYLDEVRTRSAPLKKRLWTARRRVLRLYLRQIRADFSRLWQVARSLAPMSQDPNFAALLTQQFLAFHALYAALQLSCLLGWPSLARVAPGDLVTPLQRLQLGTRQALEALEPSARAALSTRG
jgi:hypothetical protein